MAVIFAAACCSGQGAGIDRYTVRQAELRNVVIVSFFPNGDEHTCSGFIVRTSLVATAKHCSGPVIKVNGKPARIVAESEKEDVLLLSTSTPELAQIVASTDVQAGDEVFAIVSHSPWPELVTIGHVVAVSDAAIFCSVLAAPGISGGALYNSRGALIGLLNQFMATDYGDGKYQTVMFASAVPARALTRIIPQKPTMNAEARTP